MRASRAIFQNWRKLIIAGVAGLALLGLFTRYDTADAGQSLTATDAATYREIFALQSLGKMDAAGRLIAKLTDKRLLGDVLSQRYLTSAYWSSYKELQSWLAQYSDHPEAPAIYKLALGKKRLAGSAALHRPTPVRVRSFSRGGFGTEHRYGAQPMQVEWAAGLTAWRDGQFAKAGKRFAAIAKSTSSKIAPWRKAAAAYWAARAALAQRQPQQVNQFLQMAAAHPQTMYGILANRQLGRDLPFDWRLPQLASGELEQMRARPAVARVMALAEVGQTARADTALQTLYNRSHADDDEAMLALAVQLGLPVSQLRIARVASSESAPWQAGFYPVPAWQPAGGFTVDPALLYAFIKQESKFNASAQSPNGARGVMQLMPSTASFIGNNRALNGAKRNQLFDPELNMTLGQRYINHLLKQSGSKGDLFTLAIAYQAGPGRLESWRKQFSHGPFGEDPLLFVESIPSEHSRRYLERVATDYWMYQDRLGETPHTLDAIAAGEWPVFQRRSVPVARVGDGVRAGGRS